MRDGERSRDHRGAQRRTPHALQEGIVPREDDIRFFSSLRGFGPKRPDAEDAQRGDPTRRSLHSAIERDHPTPGT
jgi:hypothetical protein